MRRYMPILPTVLINGADGIGTGWSTTIPNYNPRDIMANLRCVRAYAVVCVCVWARVCVTMPASCATHALCLPGYP